MLTLLAQGLAFAAGASLSARVGLFAVVPPTLELLRIQSASATIFGHLNLAQRGGFHHGAELVARRPTFRVSTVTGQQTPLPTGLLAPRIQRRCRDAFLGSDLGQMPVFWRQQLAQYRFSTFFGVLYRILFFAPLWMKNLNINQVPTILPLGASAGAYCVSASPATDGSDGRTGCSDTRARGARLHTRSTTTAT